MHLGSWLKGSESLIEGYRSMTTMSSKLLMRPVFYTTISVQPEWMLPMLWATWIQMEHLTFNHKLCLGNYKIKATIQQRQHREYETSTRHTSTQKLRQIPDKEITLDIVKHNINWCCIPYLKVVIIQLIVCWYRHGSLWAWSTSR